MKCPVCENEHDELPDIGSDAPAYWREELDGMECSFLTEDLCVVDDEDYFIRGVLEIPIQDSDEYFGWGIWVSLKKENFENYREHFDTPLIGPFLVGLPPKLNFSLKKR